MSWPPSRIVVYLPRSGKKSNRKKYEEGNSSRKLFQFQRDLIACHFHFLRRISSDLYLVESFRGRNKADRISKSQDKYKLKQLSLVFEKSTTCKCFYLCFTVTYRTFVLKYFLFEIFRAE